MPVPARSGSKEDFRCNGTKRVSFSADAVERKKKRPTSPQVRLADNHCLPRLFFCSVCSLKFILLKCQPLPYGWDMCVQQVCLNPPHSFVNDRGNDKESHLYLARFVTTFNQNVPAKPPFTVILDCPNKCRFSSCTVEGKRPPNSPPIKSPLVTHNYWGGDINVISLN